jgi:hypothetical protein
MRYIIDRKTNEHERYDGQNYDATKYRMVEADSEGWIPHTGNECPLPLDARLEVRYASGHKIYNTWPAGMLRWRDVKSYRPILAEKVQEPEPVVKDSLTTDLLDRLDAAHKAAQQIPDLEAELREVLAGMGYTLGKLSPFEQQRHGAGE